MDLSDLPPEVVAQLRRAKPPRSDPDHLWSKITAALNSFGGVATIDELLVWLYRRHGEVHQRKKLSQALYAMAFDRRITRVAKGTWRVLK